MHFIAQRFNEMFMHNSQYFKKLHYSHSKVHDE